MKNKKNANVAISSGSRFIRSLLIQVLGSSKNISVTSVFKKMPSLSNIIKTDHDVKTDWLFVSISGSGSADEPKMDLVNAAHRGDFNLLLHRPDSDCIHIIKNKIDIRLQVSSVRELNQVLTSG